MPLLVSVIVRVAAEPTVTDAKSTVSGSVAAGASTTKSVVAKFGPA